MRAGIGDGRPTETSDAPEGWVADLERLGATVVEAQVPEAEANTWPQFLHEAAQSHAATFPSRADEYGELAVVVLRQHRDEWTPDSVARLEVIDRHIVRIVDYAHCAWVLSAATSVVMVDPS